ncbi:MAG: glycosyltransferase family 4 protein [Anaerolineae bacterium]|nr:glycosyltransferase family 4 protein [Phycisphaerae bacterium]
MKIVHIITRLILGGAQENTLLSCEGQHDRAHDVTLITGPAISPEGSLIDRAKSYGYRVIVVDEMRRAISVSKDFRTYRRLKTVLTELNPDVVHTHSSKAGIIGRWAAHRAKCRFIVHTIHGLAFTASTSRAANFIYKTLEKVTAPITHKIVCVADAMREQSLLAGVGRPGQYLTVYSGMQTAPFLNPPIPRDVVRRELGLRDEDIAVGTIARLFELKGHDDLLDIAPKLCATFPTLKFLWIGDGLLRESFKRRIAQMGLTDRFILTGLVPPEKIPQLTHAMDILVHPSRREGLARALPQGSLAEKPVITYDIDGNREALIEGETGYALPPFDKNQLAAKIALLARDMELRKKLGTRGRAFALSRFDANVMVDALEAVYAHGRGAHATR